MSLAERPPQGATASARADCGRAANTRPRIWAAPVLAAVLGSALSAAPVVAEGDADLAQQLANPIAALISVPLQFNFEDGIGPDGGGSRMRLNVQPVIPFTLSADWNVISRTIVPIVYQNSLLPGSGSQSGLGDTLQSFFFSPNAPTAGGLTWGVGPVFLLPTATDDLLGTGKWGVGPTAVALVQRGPWTVGGLANHIWSVAGDSDRADVNQTFVQPFVSFTTPDAWTLGLQAEASYDWERSEWTVPVTATVGKLVRIGPLPVSLSGGVRYWAESPAFGPRDWGARFTATILLPRG